MTAETTAHFGIAAKSPVDVEIPADPPTLTPPLARALLTVVKTAAEPPVKSCDRHTDGVVSKAS